MHYFFHFAIYDECLKSVLLYIRYLLLTVLSKAEFFLSAEQSPSFILQELRIIFLRMSGVYKQQNKNRFFVPELLRWIIGYNQAMNSRDADCIFFLLSSYFKAPVAIEHRCLLIIWRFQRIWLQN